MGSYTKPHTFKHRVYCSHEKSQDHKSWKRKAFHTRSQKQPCPMKFARSIRNDPVVLERSRKPKVKVEETSQVKLQNIRMSVP